MSQSENPQQVSALSPLLVIAHGAAAYTVLGLLAGLCWIYASPAMGIAAIGVHIFLALWWAWLLVWLPPVLVAVSVFRATEPAKTSAGSAAETEE